MAHPDVKKIVLLMNLAECESAPAGERMNAAMAALRLVRLTDLIPKNAELTEDELILRTVEEILSWEETAVDDLPLARFAAHKGIRR